ncbi:MAG: hypothetical protein JSV80_07245 [Acidobacteriota bacterium]|nr:MAG: hypothetical protein JSV80_07245 [Acidobacteriota bacterium]
MERVFYVIIAILALIAAIFGWQWYDCSQSSGPEDDGPSGPAGPTITIDPDPDTGDLTYQFDDSDPIFVPPTDGMLNRGFLEEIYMFEVDLDLDLDGDGTKEQFKARINRLKLEFQNGKVFEASRVFPAGAQGKIVGLLKVGANWQQLSPKPKSANPSDKWKLRNDFEGPIKLTPDGMMVAFVNPSTGNELSTNDPSAVTEIRIQTEE